MCPTIGLSCIALHGGLGLARYTDFDDADIRTILECYGLDLTSARQLDGGMANTSYMVNEAYVLTALDNHDLGSARRLAEFMVYLAAHGLETPQPLSDNHGSLIGEFNGRPLMLKRYVETKVPETGELDRAAGVGALLRKLHKVPVPASLGTLGRRIPVDALSILLGHDCDDLKAAITLVQSHDYAEMLGRYERRICHGDLMGDNILEKPDGTLVAIDWETVTVDAIVLDIGIAAVSAVKSALPVRAFLQQLLDGYCADPSAPSIAFRDGMMATVYSCVLMSYHRYVRQNITFPDPTKATIYQDLLPFVMEESGSLKAAT